MGNKKLGEGKYAITYQEKVCAFDAKCEAANAKCVPQLIALMKAAEAAEKALEKASAAKAAAKGNHAKATAAKAAALKEQSAAKGALDAAQALVNEATSAAATAKTQYGENSEIYKKRASAAHKALKTYQAMKKEHLLAQGAYKGKASAEMKAYNEYTAALHKHCDEEAAFAAIVATIGHPIKKAECKTRKIQTEATKMPRSPRLPTRSSLRRSRSTTRPRSRISRPRLSSKAPAVLLPRRSRSSISVSRSTALSKTSTPSWSNSSGTDTWPLTTATSCRRTCSWRSLMSSGMSSEVSFR